MNRLPDPDAQSQDALLGGRVQLYQPVAGYRVAIDPVLLAAALPAQPGDRALDLGCGAGAAALCLLARVPGVRVAGLELQAAFAELAARNAALNGCADSFRVVQGDILAPPPELAPDAADLVMMNPPYVGAGRGRAAAVPSKALATHEGEAGLAVWLDTALGLLRPRGRLAVIHRADRLDELLARLHGRAGEIRIFPLWPSAGQAARRVLIGARKGVATPLQLESGLVLHRPDGLFTVEAEAVLRDAAAIPLFSPAGS